MALVFDLGLGASSYVRLGLPRPAHLRDRETRRGQCLASGFRLAWGVVEFLGPPRRDPGADEPGTDLSGRCGHDALAHQIHDHWSRGVVRPALFRRQSGAAFQIANSWSADRQFHGVADRLLANSAYVAENGSL